MTNLNEYKKTIRNEVFFVKSRVLYSAVFHRF